MSHSSKPLVGMLLLAMAAVAHAQASKDAPPAYRWVDEKGVVHYGDRIPPEYSRGQRDVLNRQGVVIDRLEAEKTPAELAEEERRRQEIQRQHQHDTFLLTTYVSVKDIESLRDQRLDQLQGQVRAAEIYIHNLEERLRAAQARARMFRPYSDSPAARQMPDELAEDLVRTLNEIRNQRRLLHSKRAEQVTLRDQFQADIDRYRQLKAPRTTMR